MKKLHEELDYAVEIAGAIAAGEAMLSGLGTWTWRAVGRTTRMRGHDAVIVAVNEAVSEAVYDAHRWPWELQ